MRLGVAYYPELRDPASWAGDFALMRDAGIERIRMAEFAWSTMEPAPGAYAWEWLDEAIALAAAYGIETVLCTPTACPPVWLVEAHPDILPVDRYGRRTGFGARQHRCYNAPAYQMYAGDIVNAMAERYGQHPHVVAWQLDNELGGEQKRCYCDECRAAFQAHLAGEYGSLEALNESWGTAFWSQTYTSWGQIPVPVAHAADLPMRHHPSLELAFSRFSSRVITDFAHHQAAILRAFTGERPITTNAFMFRWGDNVNWYALFDGLDAVGIDLYTTQDYEIGFYADFCRGMGVPLWVMEYGAQLENLATGLSLLAERGCDWTFLFKFNPTPAGQEQSMKQLLTVTGAPAPNFHVLKDWAQTHQTEAPPAPEAPAVGLLYDFDSAWVRAIDARQAPQAQDWVYAHDMVHVVYRTLFELGYPVRVVRSPDMLDGLDALVVPWCQVYDGQLEAALIEFVRAGGILLVTHDLFHKDHDNAYLTSVPPIYRELLAWVEADFIEPGESPVVQAAEVGAGQAWMVRADMTREEWLAVMQVALEEGPAGQ
ncbi:MAG: beta-galactosidase [Anaerolineae bacterium]|nr:beta-galactosidase [Anaerolineae bacterium]